ncbi:MAG: response regulator, partial [Cyanobacteria bacterium J083]
MSSESVSILLIEDDLAQARFLQEMLKNSDLTAGNFVHVKRLQSAINQLQQDRFDVILLDLSLPDSQGLSSVETIVNHAPFMPIVVLTNTNDQQLAIAAVRQGAQDYLVKKQINQELLVRSLRYAIERQRAADLLREANQNLLTQVEKTSAELNKVQEINQLKSDLVSMFSHDFRNPLTTVLSCAELLQN